MAIISLISIAQTLNWNSPIIWVDVLSFLVLIGILLRVMFLLRKRTLENKLQQQQHAAKIDSIRKDHTDTLEKLRQEMLKREEERIRQWHESEKEVVEVLAGITSIIELSEKLGQIETDKIMTKSDEISSKLDDIQSKLSKTIIKE